MDTKYLKWMFLAMAAVVIAPVVSAAVSRYSETAAKRDIIVACYNSGAKDCQTIWDKEIN